jgi:hypothetical protein
MARGLAPEEGGLASISWAECGTNGSSSLVEAEGNPVVIDSSGLMEQTAA